MKDTQIKHTPNTLEEYLHNQHKGHLKSTFVEAFRQLGVITPTCRKVGVSRSTFYRWYLDDSDFSCALYEAFDALYQEKGELLEQIPQHKRHGLFEIRAMGE